jgi:hypothetical protein
MPDIFVGSVSVGVVPDASNWNNRLRAELVPSSSRVGDEVGGNISRKITDNMGKAGTESAGAFSDSFRKRLKAALDALPKAKVDGDTTEIDRKVEELRAKLEELAHTDIIDSNQAIAELAVIEHELSAVAREADGIDVRFNIDRARVQLAMLKREVDNVGDGGGGILGRAGIGAAGGAAGGASSAGGGALSALPGPLSNPYIATGLVAAVVAVVPQISALISGAIVSGFGLAISAMAIIGAARMPEVQQVFTNLKDRALEDFEIIGQSWVPVLESIGNSARQVLDHLTPLFTNAAKLIAGPFRLFADTIITAFTQPAVESSITAVARAFVAILKAMTPEIPKIATTLANSITAIATTVAQHPESFTRVIDFLIGVINFGLRAIVVLTDFANWLATLTRGAIIWAGNAIAVFGRLRHGVADQFDLMRHDVAHAWDVIWNNTIGRAQRGQADLQRLISQGLHNVANAFDIARHAISSTWDSVWDNTVGRARNGVRDTANAIISLKNWVVNFFSNAGSWLYNQGRNIVSGLWKGIKDAWNDVVSWFKGMPHAILKALGIASPPPWSIDAGKHIMGGLLKGIAHGAANVKDFFVNLATSITGPLKNVWSKISGVGGAIGRFFSRLVGAGGSGVARWAGVVAQALAMLGLPQSLAPRVLYQMQTESGGNPNAINNWDINAQRGDPSRGLMQTIGSTFAAYHVPGTSNNIYDPLANVAAALNYARTVYGPDLMRGSMGVGSGHGYDTGGWLPPGVTMAINRTGEPELVLTADQIRGAQGRGGDGGATYVAHFDGLTGQAIEGHVRTAFAAMSVTQGNLNRQGRRR